MFEYIFGFLAPHLCLKCGVEGSLLCTECTNSLPAPVNACYRCSSRADRYLCAQCSTLVPFSRIIIRTQYDTVAKDVVHRLKFVRTAGAAPVIAASMADMLTGFRGTAAIISYVPTASRRVRVRGYDQSRLVAKHLSKMLRLPCRPLLVRLGNTRQVGANKDQRILQAQQAFTIRSRVSVPETEIILIDDVITTGATVEAAAAVLRDAGGKNIVVATFASATKRLANGR